MFFSITNKTKNNFSSKYLLGPFLVYTDNGWHLNTVDDLLVLYKGYTDIGTMETMLPTIVQQHDPKLLGNFCVIVYDKTTNQLQIKTDRYRSFPIYVNPGESVSNLINSSDIVWSDGLVTIDSGLQISEEKVNLINPIDTSTLTRAQVIEQIINILNQETENFVAGNTLPIKVHLSGGIDSMLVYSFLQKFTDEYELVKCQHVEYDYFWLKNSSTLKDNFWGYSQIHHWTDPCILTSGAPGDEFMLRGPATVDLFLKFHGQNVINLLSQPKWHNCLMESYLKKSKNINIFKEQRLDPGWDKEMLFWNLCNIIVNDWQHWHLGNTLTWTPLRNLEIFKLLLRLPVEDALDQFMNAGISRDIIGHNNPDLLNLLSPQKNTGNVMENLTDFLLQKNNG